MTDKIRTGSDSDQPEHKWTEHLGEPDPNYLQ